MRRELLAVRLSLKTCINFIFTRCCSFVRASEEWGTIADMKLLLVDGSALLHRAYHAYPSLKTKTGEIVGAVYGVASMLITALDTEKPTHAVVAWDLPKPTFRHEKYIAYKAQRPKADAEMVDQIALVKEVIGVMGVTQIEQEGFEADDIIGTLAYNAGREKDAQVVILTGDQDTMQLVTPNVKVMTPAKGSESGKLYGPEEVLAKYGVRPDQIVDLKALVGDHSDNIPGVAGIGPVSAAKLVSEYGTLERIYESLSAIPEPIRLKLENGRDSAFMSQDLSRIVTDMKIAGTLDDWKYETVKTDAVKAKFEELNFKSLLRRLFPWEADEAKKKIPDNQMGLF